MAKKMKTSLPPRRILSPKFDVAVRLEEADQLLYQANENLVAAQALISVLLGLNGEWGRIDRIRKDLQKVTYSLRAGRESGKVTLDDTMAAALAKMGR